MYPIILERPSNNGALDPIPDFLVVFDLDSNTQTFLLNVLKAEAKRELLWNKSESETNLFLQLSLAQLLLCDSLLNIRLYPEVLANKIINYSG